MTCNPYAERYLDDDNEYRTRIVAANGKVLFVSSEGYQREEDLIISQELTRRALNDAYYSNPIPTDATMAKRDADLSHNRIPPASRSKFADALLEAIERGGR